MTESDGQVFVRCQPAPERTALDVEVFRSLLVDEGFGECLIDEKALQSAVTDCNTQRPVFVSLLAKRVNAEIQVQVEEGDTLAYIKISPAKGGKLATPEDVLLALKEAGVVSGIDSEAVAQACSLGNCDQFVIAHGTSPQKGTDAVFEELIPKTVNRAPKVDEQGHIDYREHGVINVVQPSTPLMRRIPATAGVPGYTVRGRVLEALPGRDEPFTSTLIGVQFHDTDPNLLIASIVGQPVLVAHGVMVEAVLRVREVNMATGNIHFDGTVHVDGEVVQGMEVDATGDIFVGELVDGGLLKAGGNIHVNGGVIAHGKLVAKGSVTARFAQGSYIEAGTFIALDDRAIECELKAANHIVIGAKSPKNGRLSGGSVTAMMLLKVPFLGSAKGTVTRVGVGANAELEAKYAVLQQRIAKEKAAEESLKKLVHQLEVTHDPKHMLERVKSSWQHAIQAWAKSLVESNDLNAQIAVGQSARVEIGVGVDGAVDLSFGKLNVRLRKEFSDGAFSLEADSLALIFTDSAGTVMPVS